MPLPVLCQDPYLMGVARLQEGSCEAARIQFEQVLAHDPGHPEALLKIAETYYQTNDYRNAITYFEQLEGIREGMGTYGLARSHARLGEIATSMQYLEKHLRSAYKLPSSTVLLDEAFFELENSREWKSLWKHDWYTEEELLLQEISYLTRSGNHLEALDAIDQALAGETDRASLLTARGMVFYGMGHYPQSIQAYSAAIDINRMNAAAFHGRAQSYLALGKPADAIPDLKRTRQLDPENLEILKELSGAQRTAGNFDQAIQDLEDYLVYHADQAEALYLHGQTLYDAGKYLKSLTSFNRCLELESEDPRFYFARGQAYLATSTYKYALNDFGMALDLDPKNHEVWFQKGMARWLSQDREGSISDWQKAARYGSEKAAKKLEELALRQ